TRSSNAWLARSAAIVPSGSATASTPALVRKFSQTTRPAVAPNAIRIAVDRRRSRTTNAITRYSPMADSSPAEAASTVTSPVTATNVLVAAGARDDDSRLLEEIPDRTIDLRSHGAAGIDRTGVTHHAHDARIRQSPAEAERPPDRGAFMRKDRAHKGFVDDDHRQGVAVFLVGEIAPLHDRNAHRAEVSRRHRLVVRALRE